jgi:hypothetical protein
VEQRDGEITFEVRKIQSQCHQRNDEPCR